MSWMGGFKEAYLRYCRNEFLSHKLYTYYYKTQATGINILWLELFVYLFNHIAVGKDCTDCFGILDFPCINHVAQLL